MNVFTETPSADARSSTLDLRPSPRRSVMRAERSPSDSPPADVLVLDIGQIDVVAGDPDLHAPVGELGRQLGGGVRQQVEHPAGHGAAQDGGDALGGLGHRVVAQLPDRHHVGAQPVDHQ